MREETAGRHGKADSIMHDKADRVRHDKADNGMHDKADRVRHDRADSGLHGKTEAEMRLYHTGNVEIQNPDIRRGRKNADFGQGFYLTPDKEFTYRWAGREAVINVYELDLTGLKVQQFSRDLKWFEYIYSNRRAKDTVEADIVIGPIANDTIYDTLGILSSGYLSSEDALSLLMIGPEYTQLAIKSEKAKNQLQWIQAERDIDCDKYAKLLKQEQEEYQKQFAAAMLAL